MKNFTAYNPTKLFFGKGVLDEFGDTLLALGKKTLLVTGKKSVKKYGYFDIVTQKLNDLGINYVKYEGISPNPSIKDVRKAVKLCKKEKVDFIVALGGGSVIDSAKIIAASYSNNAEPWDVMTGKVPLEKRTPLAVILTFAGTGSEMNSAAVIQNEEENLKIGFADPSLFPDYSYLDPTFTKTVPKNQTIYGIADLIAHSLEAYFAEGDAHLSDRFIAALFNEVSEVAPLLLENLHNYEYRYRIMWAATVALNGTLYHGRKTSGDWGVHSLGHALSFMFDTPHGATLSLIYPAWLKHMKSKISDRIANLGKLITGKEVTAEQTIEIIENFFKKIGAPTEWGQVELCPNDKFLIKKFWINSKASGTYHKLEEEDYDGILSKING